jgi:hypothetical protein
MATDLTRRDFLSTCGVLAASLAACTGAGTRHAHRGVVSRRSAVLGLSGRAARADRDRAARGSFRSTRMQSSSVCCACFRSKTSAAFSAFRRRSSTSTRSSSRRTSPRRCWRPSVWRSMCRSGSVGARVRRAASPRSASAKSLATEAFFQRHRTRHALCDRLIREPRVAWLQLWNVSEFDGEARLRALRAQHRLCRGVQLEERVWPSIGYEGTLLHRPERIS